ncbi:MAG: hypothetical protein AAB459_02220 [Patescibacteria group bacterium]
MILSVLQNFAHEVYVLNSEKIKTGLNDHSVHVFDALNSAKNVRLFLLFSGIIALLVLIALILSFKTFFIRIGKKLDKSSSWALVVIRIAFGASLILSAVNNSLYGPELPLGDFYAPFFLKIIMLVSGTSLIVGFKSRLFAAVSIIIWFFAFTVKGPYVLTYINYLGEAIALVMLPRTIFSIDEKLGSYDGKKFALEKYSLPIARILFAFSLLYTAITIKFTTTVLTLDVVRDFQLTRFFPFDPLFVVLGASLIEVLVGLLFLFGILQRFTSALFLIVMMLSVWFFGEAVWPHLLIIALGVGLFMHRPDNLTLDSMYLWKKHKKI